MIATYGLLSLAVLALWLGGPDSAPPWRRYAWLVLLGAATLAGLITGFVAPAGLGWIVLLAVATGGFARPNLPPGPRVIIAVVIFAVSAGLLVHWLPGFQNYRALYLVRFTPDAVPFTLFLNFDKTAAGLLLLGWSHTRLTRAADWRAIAGTVAVGAAAIVPVVIALSLGTGYVHFAPKFPPESWLWVAVNLGFTCLAEEAVFRGFFQTQVRRLLGSLPGATAWAIGISAVIFGLAHAAGGTTYIVLAVVAGVGYGWVYHRTGRIEASILTHFVVNATHFFLFTYPALQR